MRKRVASVALVLVAACRGAATGSLTAPTPSGAYDVVIENGRVVDGTGAAWFYGDVGIRGDRIAAVVPRGMLRNAQAKSRVDARNLVVAPGFIDIQDQSGGQLLAGDGRQLGKVTQGVTTGILGEGSTPAPLNPATLPAGANDMMRRFATPHGFDAWLSAMQAHGISQNVGSFVGAGTIRVYGMSERMGAATGSALDSMRAAVRRAMEDGAFGMASALIYPPNTFATTEELVEESKAMAPYGGVYITHMRSEADRYLEAIDEVIRISRESGVPGEIYHLKAAGIRNWPKARMAIAKIDSARAAGIDLQANMYPYTAGGTGLTSCLPPEFSAEGKLYENLASPQIRAKIHQEVEHPTSEWENLCELATPAGVLITSLRQAQNQPYIGKRLSEIAQMKNANYLDAAMDLILSERSRVETIYFLMSEDNIKLQMQQPWMKFGSDAGGPDPDSVRALTHPRTFGNFPRILGKYVREEHVIPLEDAVRKMTSAVAERLSIHDRGMLKPGMFADVVVFDPATIGDRATYEQPKQLSVGVRDVWVNGAQVIRDGVHTGAKPGRALRGPGYAVGTR
ncbi:MAG: D-aminoacylase domain protein [Gemmatimonadetes bacterium]|nr:D-aminoacylase domain protein [Gemmatimonadota bacterium]